jgi:hypothetical protein
VETQEDCVSGIHFTYAAGFAPTHPGYYPFIIFQPSGQVTMGVPPILKEKNANCEDCGEVHDIELCPLCGSFIYISFGFVGGGFGQYYICDGEKDCPWIYKFLSLEA